MTGRDIVIIKRLIKLAFLGIAILFSLKLAYSDAYTNLKPNNLHNKPNYNQSNIMDRGSLRAGRTGHRTSGSNSKNPSIPKPQARQITSAPQPTTTTTTTTITTPPPAKRVPIDHLAPFARIVIPKVGLDTTIVEGVDDDALAIGPGHMEETAWPGEDGNMVISGHRVTHTHPFYYIDQLQAGDSIYIYKDSYQYVYHVTGNKVVVPDDVSVINPTGGKTLTLTTCNPRYSAKTRLIVFARM